MNLNREQACYLFGQREMPAEKQPLLQQAIEKLITEQKARYFIFGHQGEFDRWALLTLRQLQKKYLHIRYSVVLAYYPPTSHDFYDHETVYPAELATIPKRFAICHRNRLMLKHATIVVCYVPYSFGASAKMLLDAKRLKKEIIQII